MLRLCGCECTYRRNTLIPSVVTLEDPVAGCDGDLIKIRIGVRVSLDGKQVAVIIRVGRVHVPERRCDGDVARIIDSNEGIAR